MDVSIVLEFKGVMVYVATLPREGVSGATIMMVVFQSIAGNI